VRTKEVVGFAIFCGAAACSGPQRNPKDLYAEAALEVPVPLRAGLYEVRLGGATVVKLRSGARTDRICIDSFGATQFPSDPFGWTVEPWENCSKALDAPMGNAMSGARICTQRRMPITARYTGAHTADYFKIQGLVSQGTGETEEIMHLGSGEFSVAGKWVGDCPG
jgi:hypothetical protein